MTTVPPTRDDYWMAARRPLAGLLFVLPMLMAYELGVIWFRADVSSVRTGADAWMQAWMMDFGWQVPVFLPLLTIGILLMWHRARGDAWRCRGETLIAMAAESTFLAFLLAASGHLLKSLVPAALAAPPQTLVRSISFIGAGLYEEVLFRLILVPLLYLAFRTIRLERTTAWIGSILLVSLTFATCHYLQPSEASAPANLATAISHVAAHSDLWFGFLFRMLAGVFFSVVFLVRGFGIAVGAHVLYDLLAGVLLVAAR